MVIKLLIWNWLYFLSKLYFCHFQKKLKENRWDEKYNHAYVLLVLLAYDFFIIIVIVKSITYSFLYFFFLTRKLLPQKLVWIIIRKALIVSEPFYRTLKIIKAAYDVFR